MTLERHIDCTPYLRERNPGSKSVKLGDCSAYPSHFSIDEAVAVGDIILTHINGTTPAECTFQKKNQVVSLGVKASFVKIDGYVYTYIYVYIQF